MFSIYSPFDKKYGNQFISFQNVAFYYTLLSKNSNLFERKKPARHIFPLFQKMQSYFSIINAELKKMSCTLINIYRNMLNGVLSKIELHTDASIWTEKWLQYLSQRTIKLQHYSGD